jgi:hypothetical protein
MISGVVQQIFLFQLIQKNGDTEMSESSCVLNGTGADSGGAVAAALDFPFQVGRQFIQIRCFVARHEPRAIRRNAAIRITAFSRVVIPGDDLQATRSEEGKHQLLLLI